MMDPPFIRSAIAAEIIRARRDRRDIDRLWLRRETGLTGRDGQRRFEALVSEITMELNSAPGTSGAEGGQGRERARHPDSAPGHSRDPTNQIRAIAAKLKAADEAARRALALDICQAQPSDLIARAMRDWPDQTKAVKRMAARLDIPLGEAWARTIAAGVKAIQRRGA